MNPGEPAKFKLGSIGSPDGPMDCESEKSQMNVHVPKKNRSGPGPFKRLAIDPSLGFFSGFFACVNSTPGNVTIIPLIWVSLQGSHRWSCGDLNIVTIVQGITRLELSSLES